MARILKDGDPIDALREEVASLRQFVEQRVPHECRCSVCANERLRQTQLTKQREERDLISSFLSMATEARGEWLRSAPHDSKWTVLHGLRDVDRGRVLLEADNETRADIIAFDQAGAEKAIFAVISIEPHVRGRLVDPSWRVVTPRNSQIDYPGVRLGPDCTGLEPEPLSTWRARLSVDPELVDAVEKGRVVADPVDDRTTRQLAYDGWRQAGRTPPLLELLERGRVGADVAEAEPPRRKRGRPSLAEIAARNGVTIS